MKKGLFFLIGLGYLFSCATKDHTPTGDMQFFDLRGNVSSFDLRGNVSSWDNENFFRNNMASFDKDGYLIITDQNPTVESRERINRYMLQEYNGPFKMVKYDFELAVDLFNEGVDLFNEGQEREYYKALIYDSSNRLIAIDGDYNSYYLYYDDKGRLSSVVSTEEGGMVTDFYYDNKGIRIKEHCFVPVIKDGYIDRHNVAVENWTLEYERHRFDKHGNWVGRWAVKKYLDGTIQFLQQSEQFREGKIKYYDE